VLLILATDKTLEIEPPDHVPRLHEVERREGNLDGSCPSIGGNMCHRHPHSIPTRVEVRITGLTSFVDESVALRSQRINLKCVSVATVVGRIDHNLDPPDHVPRLHEVERREGNLDGSCPSIGGNMCHRHPHSIPTRVEVRITGLTSFVDESVALRSQRINLKCVSVATVVGRIDHN